MQHSLYFLCVGLQAALPGKPAGVHEHKPKGAPATEHQESDASWKGNIYKKPMANERGEDGVRADESEQRHPKSPALKTKRLTSTALKARCQDARGR